MEILGNFSYRHLSQESEIGFVITTMQNTLLASDESAFQVAWRRWGVPQIRDKYHSFSAARFLFYFLGCHDYTIRGSICVLTSMIFKPSKHSTFASAKEWTSLEQGFHIQSHKNNPVFQDLPSNVIIHLHSIQINLYFKENKEDNTCKLVGFVPF